MSATQSRHELVRCKSSASSTVDRFWLSLAGHMNAKSLREGPMRVSIWHLITVRLRGIYSCPKNFCIVQRQTQIRFCGGLMAGTQMTSDVWEAITIECEGKVVTGSYSTSDWMIPVKMNGGGTKSAQLEKTPPKNFGKIAIARVAQTRRRM
jgi:hypothetical protein